MEITNLKFPVVINRKNEPSNDSYKSEIVDIEIIINFDIIIVWWNIASKCIKYKTHESFIYNTHQDISFLWNNPPNDEIMELIIQKLNECMGLDSCIGILELFATKQ